MSKAHLHASIMATRRYSPRCPSSAFAEELWIKSGLSLPSLGVSMLVKARSVPDARQPSNTDAPSLAPGRLPLSGVKERRGRNEQNSCHLLNRPQRKVCCAAAKDVIQMMERRCA